MSERQAATIRLANAGDVTALASWSDTSRQWAVSTAFSELPLRDVMDDRETNVIVAQDATGIAALGIMHYDEDDAQVLSLSVDPARDDWGAAQAILRWFERTALTAGIGLMSLAVRSVDDAACAFFVQAGYQTFGPPHDDGETIVRFAKDLWA
jgi:Acetyltransferase (GNAT) family